MNRVSAFSLSIRPRRLCNLLLPSNFLLFIEGNAAKRVPLGFLLLSLTCLSLFAEVPLSQKGVEGRERKKEAGVFPKLVSLLRNSQGWTARGGSSSDTGPGVE